MRRRRRLIGGTMPVRPNHPMAVFCSSLFPFAPFSCIRLYLTPGERVDSYKKHVELTHGFSLLRCLDQARTRLCDTQILYLHPSALDRCGDAQGRQDVTELGMEYWQDAHEEGHFSYRSQHRQDWSELGEVMFAPDGKHFPKYLVTYTWSFGSFESNKSFQARRTCGRPI